MNSLLDFSRIEAGRVRASYEPIDIAAYTADLASVFRSACEKAGLRLVVDCPPLAEPVFVDREMWEKVVLNSALQRVQIHLRGRDYRVSSGRPRSSVVLRVCDTGVGIPAEEMPKLFERFHRVESAGAAALMKAAESAWQWSTSWSSSMAVRFPLRATWSAERRFIISIPLGSEHLPRELIGHKHSVSCGRHAQINPFVEEAMRWLPGVADDDEPVLELPVEQDQIAIRGPASPQADGTRPHVLVADDNADMRQYLVRLLAEHYVVEAVADGDAALAAVRRQVPNLILTDVMMPQLDGFGLLRELRADPRTAGVPVIMLSARAGEESWVEGIEAGADDYLVKPFSARELSARVASLLADHTAAARIRASDPAERGTFPRSLRDHERGLCDRRDHLR